MYASSIDVNDQYVQTICFTDKEVRVWLPCMHVYIYTCIESEIDRASVRASKRVCM